MSSPGAARFFSITSDRESIADRYDVVVVGSGYGGGCAALRFSQMRSKSTGARLSVAVFERGRERLPGQFPTSTPDAIAEAQITVSCADTPTSHVGPRDGLYDIRVYDDVIAVVGCGLGGGSLINAGVIIEPDPRVFESRLWPDAIRVAYRKGDMERYADRVRNELSAQVYPDNWPRLTKLEAIKDAAARLQERGVPPGASIEWRKYPMAVSFEQQGHPSGYVQPACNLCGNCVTGCNTGAKNTTQMNYIADAWASGARIFTEVQVTRVKTLPGEYLVFYKPTGDTESPERFVRAGRVVLAAGALGSTEILLRSRSGVRLSSAIGRGYSGNGDSLGMGVGLDRRTATFGNPSYLDKAQHWNHAPGPCIASGATFTMRKGVVPSDDVDVEDLLKDDVILEDATFPYALKPLIAPLMPLATVVEAAVQRPDQFHQLLYDLARQPTRTDVNHVVAYLVMSHDDPSKNGSMSLKQCDDTLDLRWPGSTKLPNYQRANDVMEAATNMLNGEGLIGNPAITLTNRTITVHSLGGCCMSDTPSKGVVDDRCRVYDGDDGGVHQGLYVMDGSIIPLAIGINPSLTITTLAERALAKVVEDDPDLEVDTETVRGENGGSRTMQRAYSFTERMQGSVGVVGGQQQFPISLSLTISSIDPSAIMGVVYPVSGTTVCQHISKEHLAVHGTAVFEDDPDAVAGARLIYRLTLLTQEGIEYQAIAKKYLRNKFSSPFELFHDATTAFVEMTHRDGLGKLVTLSGTIKVSLLDALRIPLTFRSGTSQHRTWTDRLRDAFACSGALKISIEKAIQLYVMLQSTFDHPSYIDKVAYEPRTTTFTVTTADGLDLLITRYERSPRSQQRRKHPIAMFAGQAVVNVYQAPTIAVNAVQFMTDRGFDVYVGELRFSPWNPEAARQGGTLNDIASKDYPALLGKILELSKSSKVSILAHCLGAISFSLALLHDANIRKRVRAVCLLQGHFMPQTGLYNNIRKRMYLDYVFKALHWKGLDPSRTSSNNIVLRGAIGVISQLACGWGEFCSSPACHMTTFTFGRLVSHDQLNHDTHAAYPSIFGYSAFSFLFDAVERLRGPGPFVKDLDTLLPELVRAQIPIHLVNGAENVVWVASAARNAYDTLVQVAEKNRVPTSLFSLQIVDRYSHLDCLYGKNAYRDVFPPIANFFEAND